MKQNVIWNRIRRKLTSRQGMTMVELLVVVAIIGILSGVGFVSVARYQRGMAQLERDGIAKEIFVAAQNHLTAAQGQGYLGLGANSTNFGQEGTATEDSGKDVFYYVVNNGAASSGAGMFAQMLPFGSIDETIRTGGSYLIRYQPKAGLVLDVFYCSTSGSPAKFNCELNEVDDVYTSVMGLRNNKSGRRTYEDGHNSVLGYYGGAEAETLATLKLDAPKIEVFNEDILHVKITDAPKNATSYSGQYSLKLILTGKLSGAQKSFVLKTSTGSSETVEQSPDFGGRLTVSGTEYDLLLDDITQSGMHFRTIPGELKDASNNIIPFIPGEDVTVQAVAYSTSALANIAYSESRTTNSLFADGTSTTQALIASFRHLENLDDTVISNLDANDSSNLLNISSAVQIKDLKWSEFSDNSTVIYGYIKMNNICYPATYEYCYYPVNPSYSLAYDGKSHSISGLKVNHKGNAGLFGTTLNLSVSNLQLIDFSVISCNNVTSGNAGALAGTMSRGCSVSNVVAFNSPAKDSTFKTNANINSTGVAGGLIGNISEECNVTNCAAALYVSGKTYSGGLAGTSKGSITGCYSGGRTDRGEYYKHDSNGQRTDPIDPIYNVTADSGGVAGGLVGDAGSSTILNSYSTCSVSGTTAGGFVGSASGSISNCYCTGLVSGTGDNAFIGSGTLTTNTGNQYYKIVNEMITYDGDGMITAIAYKEPGAAGITAIDADNDSFNTFVGGASNWTPAAPYDTTLNNNYGGRFNLKTVGELGATVQTTNFVNTHYGDWPSPELFFVNTPTSS